jgi:hypothetical protein
MNTIRPECFRRGQTGANVLVDDDCHPRTITEEYETVHADLLVTLNHKIQPM